MQKNETIVLAGGCFWCLEAIYNQMSGVTKVEVGYTGGTWPNPTYEQVCSEKTGHAEAVRVNFDPNTLSLKDILTIFWSIHDPTTLNRQGNDVGTQYRSAIFYANERQKQEAEISMEEALQSGVFSNPIVTEVTALEKFFIAEDYHKDYFQLHKNQSYCRLVIDPKVQKFKKQFKSKLR